MDQYVSFDALAVPGIQKECGREVAAVTVPGVVIGAGSCAWTGAVETAAEASAITINAWPSRRRIIASLPWFVGVCADFHSARTGGAGVLVRLSSGAANTGSCGLDSHLGLLPWTSQTP
ncbi:hypothetical protein AB0K68_42610 [Streptomyces sp. NPDC050698]